MLQALQRDQIRVPQSLHEQGCECDFDCVKWQERDDALCEADGEGDVHQVYVPKRTEGVAGKNAQKDLVREAMKPTMPAQRM